MIGLGQNLCLLASKSITIHFQLLLTNPPDLILLLRSQMLPHRLLHLDDAQGFGMAEHLHILEAFEGVGEDVVCIDKNASGMQSYKKKCYICEIKQIDSEIWTDSRISK